MKIIECKAEKFLYIKPKSVHINLRITNIILSRFDKFIINPEE